MLDGTASLDGIVVDANSPKAVTLRNLTIENSGGYGIRNEGALKLIHSTVSGNTGLGGIVNGGSMTIIDSTIANNSDTGNGPTGGIDNAPNGTMTILASTISGNTAPGEHGPGGIYGDVGSKLTLGATIVANNPGGNCGAAVAGALRSAGYNLTNDRTRKACSFNAPSDRVNAKPGLGQLANNGGPTRTMLPAAGGRADDAIPTNTSLSGVRVCPGIDQRGATRPAKSDSRCTIGAAEV